MTIEGVRMDINQVAARFPGARKQGRGFIAKCPCHKDNVASLSIDQKPGADGKERVFICCHAGCGLPRILAAIGLTTKDLIVHPDPERPGRRGGAHRAQGTDGGAHRAQPGAHRAQDPEGDGGQLPAGPDGEDAPPELPTEIVNGLTVHTVGAADGQSGAGNGNGGSGSSAAGGTGSGSGAAGSQRNPGNGSGNAAGGQSGNGAGAAGGQSGNGEESGTPRCTGCRS